MIKAVGLRVAPGPSDIKKWNGEHSVLRKHIAARRERIENSDAIRQFRRMRLISEFTRAHDKMEEPKTLGQLVAEEAKAKLGKVEAFLAGATLPL